MTCTQINLWTCDICGIQEAVATRTSAFEDPVVHPPKSWSGEFLVPKEKRSHPGCDLCDACPACQEHPDWSKYKD